MAIQLPNFLGVPVRTPDYSGLGDAISNYYSGKMMPKDDLIKAVQAQFAKPDAQATLLGLQLANREKQLSIQKTMRDMAQEKALNDAIAAALGGGGSAIAATPPVGGASAVGTPSASGMPAPSAPQSNMTMANDPATLIGNVNPALGQYMATALQKNQPASATPPMTYPSMAQPTAPAAAPAQPQPATPPADGMTGTPMPTVQPTTKTNETVLSEGNPRLAGIDELYDNNPYARPLIEKRFGKKTQAIKFDNRTGRTSVITTYPSGKITVQSLSQGETSGDGIPLTNTMVSQHQRVVSSVDNALPLLDEMLKLPKFNRWSMFNSDDQNKYTSLRNELKDNLLGAFGLRPTEQGLETVEKMLLIGHGESDAAFRKRINTLIEHLKAKKNYSAAEIKRTNKIQPINRMSSGGDIANDDVDYSNLGSYDQGGDE